MMREEGEVREHVGVDEERGGGGDEGEGGANSELGKVGVSEHGSGVKMRT